MENDEKTNEERQTDERDEMDDLDVTQQQAEDIKGGRRAKKTRTSRRGLGPTPA